MLTIRIILAAVLILSLSVTPIVPPAPVAHAQTLQDIKNQIDRKKDDLNKLHHESVKIQKDLEEKQRREQAVSQQLNSLDRQIEATESELARVRKELEDARKQLSETGAELSRAEEELRRREDLLARRVQAIYEFGTLSYLNVLFSAQTFADFLTRFDNLRRIVTGDVTILNRATDYRDFVGDLKARHEEEKVKVEDLLAQVESKMAQLERKKANKNVYRQDLAQDIEALRQAYDELEKESQRLTTQLQELEKEFESQLRRTGAIYLERPVQARVTSPFGYRWHPVLKQYRLHTGTDYGAPYGTPIKAAESGLVTHADWLGGYGKAVVIMHGKGISTLYAHMSTVTVAGGQRVEKGQVIGNVGSTGLSTGPHLHWEVRVNGVPKDAADYIFRFID